MWWTRTHRQETELINARLAALHERVAYLEAELEAISDLASALVVRIDRAEGITRHTPARPTS